MPASSDTTSSTWTDGLTAKVRTTPRWALALWLMVSAAVYYFFEEWVQFYSIICLATAAMTYIHHRHPRLATFIYLAIAIMCGGR